jgi:hypothetical protein
VGLRDLMHERGTTPRLHPPQGGPEVREGSIEKGPERDAPSLHY